VIDLSSHIFCSYSGSPISGNNSQFDTTQLCGHLSGTIEYAQRLSNRKSQASKTCTHGVRVVMLTRQPFSISSRQNLCLIGLSQGLSLRCQGTRSGITAGNANLRSCAFNASRHTSDSPRPGRHQQQTSRPSTSLDPVALGRGCHDDQRQLASLLYWSAKKVVPSHGVTATHFGNASSISNRISQDQLRRAADTLLRSSLALGRGYHSNPAIENRSDHGIGESGVAEEESRMILSVGELPLTTGLVSMRRTERSFTDHRVQKFRTC